VPRIAESFLQSLRARTSLEISSLELIEPQTQEMRASRYGGGTDSVGVMKGKRLGRFILNRLPSCAEVNESSTNEPSLP